MSRQFEPEQLTVHSSSSVQDVPVDMSKQVLVTGGAGFIGSHVTDELVDRGHEVIVLDNRSADSHADRNADARYVWGDIRETETVAPLLEQVDVVSHQAGLLGSGRSLYDIEPYVDVNSRGTAHLLDVLLTEDIDLEKFVVASSMSVYGEGLYHCPDCDATEQPPPRSADGHTAGAWNPACSTCGTRLSPVPTPESTPLNPDSVYAITKRSQEELALAVHRAHGLPVVALRYFNTYGSRQSLTNPYAGVCAIFANRIRNDTPPILYEDGQQTRDFVHVADVARANVAAIERGGADGHAVNVGTGQPHTIEEIARTLIKLLGRDDTLEPTVTNEFRAGDIRHCYADCSRAERLLGFQSAVALADGLTEFIAWTRDHPVADGVDDAHEALSEHDLVGDVDGTTDDGS